MRTITTLDNTAEGWGRSRYAFLDKKEATREPGDLTQHVSGLAIEAKAGRPSSASCRAGLRGAHSGSRRGGPNEIRRLMW